MIEPRASRANTRKTLEAAAPADPVLVSNSNKKRKKDSLVTPPLEQSVDPSAVLPTGKGKGSKKKKGVEVVVPGDKETINADANQTAVVDPAAIHAEYAKKFAELEAKHAIEMAVAKQPIIPLDTQKDISGLDKQVLALANLGIETSLLLEQANKVSSGPDIGDQDKVKENSSKVRFVLPLNPPSPGSIFTCGTHPNQGVRRRGTHPNQRARRVFFFL